MKPTQVALYARVSTDQQTEAQTVASQVAALRERVATDGLVVPEAMQFLDEGSSGATLVRPALERLRDVIAAGAIDRLYVHSPDRLARKYAYQVLLVEEFRRAEVEVIFLNRGRADGISRQMPVIVPEGLVGRVAQVSSGASIVQLLNDPTSTVGAVVQRTRTPGLVEGEPGGGVRFKFMARDGAGVTPGDLVVTSGLGTLFPKGIPVGRVTAIEDKGSALFHFAVLTPAVDFARVEEVLLLTGQSAQDVAGSFTPDG